MTVFFILIGFAAIFFLIYLIIKTIMSPQHEQPQEKKTKPAVVKETPHASGRSMKTNRETEFLVHLMEDGNVEEIDQALKNGVNLQRPLQDGQTVLMIAVKHNQDPEIIPFLCSKGIDINAVDDKGQTALMLAALFDSNPEIVKALLKNGPDKTIRDKTGKSAADYCKMNFEFHGTKIPDLLFIK